MIEKMTPSKKRKPMTSFIFLNRLKVAKPTFGNYQIDEHVAIYFY